jgi:hypothetical protein
VQLDEGLFSEEALELALSVFGRLLAVPVPEGPPADDALDRPAAALCLPELRVGQISPVKIAVY